ncbi:hypothetical protein CBR_g35014 [Chara braunii]|uniref:Uncharacterized protein n=1 Tax=Chara braunii TaxID=69332 RepID=A0A388LK19_CHABU|nr:hypothetical protein CBR_g35014 [Chara braunii]|eukprot:GBG82649.1 hypothetical protein CBR_g35014 [Chara braunii]
MSACSRTAGSFETSIPMPASKDGHKDGGEEERLQPVEAILKVANPGPMGLTAFAVTTFTLSMFNAGILPRSVEKVAVPLGYFYGGSVQLLAGLAEILNRNTFGATAFCSYGSFWIAFAYYVTAIVPSFDGPEKENVHVATGVFLFTFTVFTTYMAIASTRTFLATSAEHVSMPHQQTTAAGHVSGPHQQTTSAGHVSRPHQQDTSADSSATSAAGSTTSAGPRPGLCFMDEKSGETDEAYQARMLLLITEAKQWSDAVAAAANKNAEDADKARLLAIEQQRQQDEAVAKAADEERIQQHEKIFSGERALLTIAADWRAKAETDIQMGFKAIKHYFISRSCPALGNALTHVEDTLTTQVELFDKAA